MKKLLSKTLFISLLLSATIPSGIQADWFTVVKDSVTKIGDSLAVYGNKIKGDSVVFSNQARERAKQVWSNSADFSASAKKATADFLKQVREKPEFKYAGAALGIAAVLYGLNYKFDLLAKVEKKRKKAWKNKWVRYSTYTAGTGLALTALYAGLVYQGYLPALSMGDLQCRMVKCFKLRDETEVRQTDNVVAGLIDEQIEEALLKELNREETDEERAQWRKDLGLPPLETLEKKVAAAAVKSIEVGARAMGIILAEAEEAAAEAVSDMA